MGLLDFFNSKPKGPYVPIEEAETVKGSYNNFYKKLLDKSLILLIVGKRGSGKTAFGMKMIDTFARETRRKCYVLGFEHAKMPGWLKKAGVIEDIPNNSVALLDEGAVLFSSRDAMKNPNKELGKLMAVARHKNLTLIIITQNSALVDLNVLRLADTLMLKEPSLMQATFERKAVKEMYEKVSKMFQKKENKEQLTYIWDDDFEGLVRSNLPNFWNEGISKSFKDVK